MYRIFFVLFAANILVNMDHGTLPACVPEVKKSYSITNIAFGSLGTAVYAGLSFGSILGSRIYQKTDTVKYILSISLAANGICLILFTINKSFTLGLTLRFLSGIFQIFTIIITPVWADAFGSSKMKSIWITAFLFSSLFGIFLGFVITSWMNSITGFGWQTSYYIQAFLNIPCCILIFMADTECLDVEIANKHRAKCLEEVESKYINIDKEK